MWKVVLFTGVVYLLYIILGGCIFMFLELDRLEPKPTFDEDDITIQLEDMRAILLKNFSQSDLDEVIAYWETGKPELYFSGESFEKARSWTYSNAFFFAFHLCTTIGYGNVAPKTVWGQMLAVIYAMFGIPFNILFFKIFGESFAQNYQGIMWRIKGYENSFAKKILGDVLFFVPWTIVFFVLPAIIFMFTEEWNFVEGIYYSFITLSTVGLGDYVAGSSIVNNWTYSVYRLFLLVWMVYGLAYVSVLVDYFTHLYHMYLLFTSSCTSYKCRIKFERVYLDIEKLDLHFRLLRAERMKQHYSMWAVREGTRLAVGFQTNHMITVATLCERIEGEIIDLLQIYAAEDTEVDPEAVPKPAFPLKKIVENEERMKKIPKDIFPARTSEDD